MTKAGRALAPALAALNERLGITLRDPDALKAALTHRSYAYEQGLTETNERLELLGDAVLNFVVTEMLYRTFPAYQEGDLAKLRASLVSTPALAEVAAELRLGAAVRLGRGEEMTGGRSKASIMADALEAVIGAVYMDRGLQAVRRMIKAIFGPLIEASIGRAVPRDAKTALQEVVTRLHGTLPRYEVTSAGPDHAKQFSARVLVAGAPYGEGEGRSKKEAEQMAAAAALDRLDEEGALAAQTRRAADQVVAGGPDVSPGMLGGTRA